MEPKAHPDLTGLLQAWSRGDTNARDKLWRVVFPELRRLAYRCIKQERSGHTLETHALINELYMRLVDWKTAHWSNRAHFFGMSARMMRQILVDHARTRAAQKRGGNADQMPLDEAITLSESRCYQLVLLDGALNRLAQLHPRKGDVVELRFFGGLSMEEIAEALKVSRVTVIRDWNFARAWLLAEMKAESDAG
jgi:RNA polymerase sigma factor (TIGR02999 family)